MERLGVRGKRALAPYHALLAMGWPHFLGLLAVFYLAANAVFAFAYLACGVGALSGQQFASYPLVTGAFLRAYFFSVETFGTVGYGNIAPVGLAANAVVTAESFVGLLSAALATGLVFARFSRPAASVIYSRYALIAPYHDITGFMFRCANERRNQLIEVSVRLIYSRLTKRGSERVREFSVLPLEFEKVTFFALSWTVVHPIDSTSPLYGMTREQLLDSEAEFLILLSGADDAFSQTVHSRTSYRADEVVWNARFRPMFVGTPAQGTTGMDLARIHDFERLGTIAVQ